MSDIVLLKKEVKSIMNNDSAHDFEHVMRVYKNAQKICKKEKVPERLVLGAVLLHDVVSYPNLISVLNYLHFKVLKNQNKF